MPEFRLHKPETLQGALELMDALENCKPIAGGTDLLLFIREGVIQVKHLVDITGIEELKGVRLENGELNIGAATTLNDVAESNLIAEKVRVIRDSILQIGGVQTRNQGTIGGNLCNASPAADLATPLLVLDAKLEVASKREIKIIPVGQLFAGSKKNSLDRFELVTTIRFHMPSVKSGAAFHKLGRRKGSTLSIVNAAAYLEMDGEICEKNRLALGAVATTPIRIPEAEKFLKGRRLTNAVVEESSEICGKFVSPIDDIRGSAEYRRDMSKVIIRRALKTARKRAEGNLNDDI
jgi:carbon-monoxide dehydrogenase medium subunit